MRILVGLHGAGAARHVGAEVGDAVHMQRAKFSFLVQGEAGGREVIAGLVVGQECL